MSRILPLVAVLGFTIFCFIDALQARRVKVMPKALWVLITLIPALGGLLWLTVGRVWGSSGSGGAGGGRGGGRGPIAPDDDEDFLRGLK